MAKTRVEIQFETLAILTGGDVGTTPSAEDADYIDGHIDSVVAELAGEDVYISDPDALEEKLFQPFCELVAQSAAKAFGGKSNPQEAQLWRNRIKKLCAPTPGYGPQETSYF